MGQAGSCADLPEGLPIGVQATPAYLGKVRGIRKLKSLLISSDVCL